jgi:L-iditol 2-dehydrogenase
MKALVLVEYNRLEIQDIPEPQLGPEDVLIEVKACGICGSDVHGLDGSTGRRRPPLVMGHEASGVIAQTGRDVHGWAAGDRVTFDSTIYCGQCHFCRRGQINLCENRRVLGVSCDEYRQHGAFAQYVAVPQRILYRLPDAVTFERAALLEPLAIACHAVERTKISLADTAVVVGAGMIGLLVVQCLRVAGCGRIIAVDLDERRLKLACKLGADEGLRADADATAAILQRTGGRGADVAMEAVGISPTVQLAVASLRRGGQLTLVGNLSPKVELPLQAVVTRELTLNGSCASCGEYAPCLELLARGAVDVDAVISAVAPLDEGASWFQRLRQGDEGLLKVVLTP